MYVTILRKILKFYLLRFGIHCFKTIEFVECIILVVANDSTYCCCIASGENIGSGVKIVKFMYL